MAYETKCTVANGYEARRKESNGKHALAVDQPDCYGALCDQSKGNVPSADEWLRQILYSLLIIISKIVLSM